MFVGRWIPLRVRLPFVIQGVEDRAPAGFLVGYARLFRLLEDVTDALQFPDPLLDGLDLESGPGGHAVAGEGVGHSEFKEVHGLDSYSIRAARAPINIPILMPRSMVGRINPALHSKESGATKQEEAAGYRQGALDGPNRSETVLA